MTRLYELVGQFKALEALEGSDEIPAEVMRDTLEGLTGDIQEKSKAVAGFIRSLDSSADAIDAAAKQMTARAKRLRDRAESLQNYLKLNMQACGISKIECPYFTLQLKKNPPAVIVDDESAVPAKYWVQPPAPPPRLDKKAIAADIKAGQQVEGCRSQQDERLEIRA